MKKKLLYLTSILLFSAASVNAQTTWDFSTPATTVGNMSTTNSATINTDPNNGTTTPAIAKWGPTYNSATVGATIIATGYPGLEFHYKNSSAIKYNINFINGTANNGYFQANGSDVGITIKGCTAGQNIAVQYSSKNDNPLTAADFAAATGGNTALPAMFAKNQTLNTATSATTSTDKNNIVVVNLTVTADGDVNILAGSSGYRIYKIVKGGTLGTNDFQAGSSVVVYANDGAINVSNVTSATKVSVYSVLGSLVKSIETSEDTSVAINAGVYVVKAQSAEGTKTAKVIVQ